VLILVQTVYNSYCFSIVTFLFNLVYLLRI